jgi:hypothetical protein
VERQAPAVDAVGGRDDLGRLVRALSDGRPYPAIVLARAEALQLERGAGRLPETRGREAAVDGGLGDGVGVEDSLPLVHGLPRAHQEVAVRQPRRRHAEQPARRGGRGGERERQRRAREKEEGKAPCSGRFGGTDGACDGAVACTSTEHRLAGGATLGTGAKYPSIEAPQDSGRPNNHFPGRMIQLLMLHGPLYS